VLAWVSATAARPVLQALPVRLRGGGEEPGLRGGRAKGQKALVGVAVELKQPRRYGRSRMASLAKRWRLDTHSAWTAPGWLSIGEGPDLR